MLTGVLGFADFLIAGLDHDDALRQDAVEIRTAARRAADITRQLLTFSKREVREPRLVDINATVREMRRLLERFISEDIRLTSELADSIPLVLIDPGQLEQVILNLVVNARDAMGGAGGEVCIGTAITPQDGGGVALTVRDTGSGMDEATRCRVFEPFFSTKKEGAGSGLGLAVVYGIVENAGGRIDLQSTRGEGTTVRIALPRARRTRETSAIIEARPADLRGTERVLLAEDDAGIQHVVARTLTALGYHVTTARDGASALAAADGMEAAPDILVTDVVMPGMSGWELALNIRARWPALPVLFLSGYSDIPELDSDSLDRFGARFLGKPFEPDALAARLRATLDQPTPAPGEV